MTDARGHFRLTEVGGSRTGTAFVWVLISDVGQLMASAGPFPDKATANEAIQWLKENAAHCGVVDPQPEAQEF